MEETMRDTELTADNAEFVSDTRQKLHICEVCGEPTEMYHPDWFYESFPGFCRSPLHRKRACERSRDAAEQEERRKREHEQKVLQLLDRCFNGNRSMRDKTFAASAAENAAVAACRKYADAWEKVRKDNLGLILWGDVGTGKSYMAACIANALIEQEIPVLMINLGDVINASFEVREDLMKRVKQSALLIIDDFGMERETDFGMEIAFQVIDARYQSRKPMIITTNRSIKALQTPGDLAHKRIYDRILEVCAPVHFKGTSLRPDIHRQKMDLFREILSE